MDNNWAPIATVVAAALVAIGTLFTIVNTNSSRRQLVDVSQVLSAMETDGVEKQILTDAQKKLAAMVGLTALLPIRFRVGSLIAWLSTAGGLVWMGASLPTVIAQDADSVWDVFGGYCSGLVLAVIGNVGMWVILGRRSQWADLELAKRSRIPSKLELSAR